MHNFRSSLAKGKLGEELFNKHFPELKALNGRESDFIAPDGTLWELKTDSYDMNKTANFFFERFSNWSKQSDGGPWQALHHGSTNFAYMFTQNSKVFIFRTADLVYHLNRILSNYEAIKIPNRGYETIGYKIPREELSHIYEEVTLEHTRNE